MNSKGMKSNMSEEVKEKKPKAEKKEDNKATVSKEKTTSEKKKNEMKIKGILKNKYNVDIDIHITRPQAMIISGRTKDFTSEQKSDFRIIKRKFSNVVDIISYDDLLDRLKRLIESVSIKK